MAETVSGRLPDDLVRALDELGRSTGQSRSEMLRIVVQRGVAEVRLERGLDAYRRREVSLGRAAEIAGVHLTVFLDALRRAGIHLNYGLAELAEDMDWAERA